MSESDKNEWEFLAADAATVGAKLPAEHFRFLLQPAPQQLAALCLREHRLSDPLQPPQPPQHADYLLLHGAGLYAHCFDPVSLLLPGTRVAVDLPGHGDSAWRHDADYTAPTLAATLATALAPLISTTTQLVGHSLGGLTAAALVPLLPQPPHTLVIIDITPATLGSGHSAKIVEFLTGKRRFESIAEMVQRAIAFGFGSDPEVLRRGVTLNARWRGDHYEWAHHFAQLPGLLPATAAVTELEAAGWEALSQAADCGTRVVLVRAEQGFVSAAAAAQWQRRLPQGEVLTLAGSHNLHDSNPVQLAQILRAYGTGTLGSSGGGGSTL